MNLIKKIIYLNERDQHPKDVIEKVLNRESYKDFSKEAPIVVPLKMRKEYFSLLQDLVDVRHGITTDITSLRSLESNGWVKLYGRDFRGTSHILTYGPESIQLEISDYSFNGKDLKDGIHEIGLIKTVLNKQVEFETEFHAGNNFQYYSGYTANHAISSAIDKIQQAVHIPHISEEKLDKIQRYRNQNDEDVDKLIRNGCFSS